PPGHRRGIPRHPRTVALDALGLRRSGGGDFLRQEHGNLRGGTGPAPRRLTETRYCVAAFWRCHAFTPAVSAARGPTTFPPTRAAPPQTPPAGPRSPTGPRARSCRCRHDRAPTSTP